MDKTFHVDDESARSDVLMSCHEVLQAGIEDGTSAASVSPGFGVEGPLAPEDLQLCRFQDFLDLHIDFCVGAFVMS